jgi:hypothetical protein
MAAFLLGEPLNGRYLDAFVREGKRKRNRGP